MIAAPWITATQWNVISQKFTVSADIGEVVQRYGPGVYTVILWSQFGGEDEPVSEYSIFYGVEPPDTYSR